MYIVWDGGNYERSNNTVVSLENKCVIETENTQIDTGCFIGSVCCVYFSGLERGEGMYLVLNAGNYDRSHNTVVSLENKSVIATNKHQMVKGC